jgi:hypothetical protein
VARQRILIPPFPGSNPGAPASFTPDLQDLWEISKSKQAEQTELASAQESASSAHDIADYRMGGWQDVPSGDVIQSATA